MRIDGANGDDAHRKAKLMPILNRAAEIQDEVAGWRRHLHTNPELLYDVHKTAAFVADKLKEFGCDEVVTGIGRTGVVGIISGSQGAGQDDRPARRHGRAADDRGERQALGLDQSRQDARLRP